MKNHSRQAWAGWLVTAAVLIYTLAGCKTENTEATLITLPEKVSVLVKPVTCVSTHQTIFVSGTLEADQTAPLSFLVPGKVNRLLVDEGSRVRKGDLLSTLEADDYRNNLAIAEAALSLAKDNYERYEPLYQNGAFAEKNFIELKTGLAKARAARDIARKALADTALHAPIPGIIGIKGIEIGQMVSPQVVAFTVVKSDVIYARVSVPESEIDQVRLGQQADVVIPALDGQTFIGKVSMIGPVADPRSRTYDVKIKLSNPEFLLRPGMIVRSGIVTGRTVDILTVPGSAIVRDADNLTYVFVADARTELAQRKRVEPGTAVRKEIEIKSGLAPEDVVIVAGQNKLTDGTPISIAKIGVLEVDP
ncbi:MexH family multidrug efflux RND transporter periplasmic adaptor subunit [Desulfosarcina ovata subsp. sediminis]|uniref:MexH family multidrug efflux RND transporter periplasmic adaptor subunit n=1 Tax=Desulfosarcina ovata subsp. sediminis TaxID=885957 RepID=A0A5K7ZLB0_9BACT|nr:efflux RND transporter periplasmic adaptor subunit [Desulfosarcina ovata]BBO81055.1 MexH family multidrug efflux RND transporter periplasmic adaptor subunit [Desulfosarcina ovata subsp. sediminis]